MAIATPPMLAELPENAATGQLAEIYEEIRRFSGVSYVSSLQKYLATMPGVLEWAWGALRPAMVSGVVPETGWRLAENVRLSPTIPVSNATLREWRVTADDLRVVRNIAANFARVSPVNLLTGACLSQLLTGARPSGPGFQNPWTPPHTLPPMPGNVDPQVLPPDQQAQLMRFATQVDGTPFIPALYRQLGHFPPVLAWLADELAPRFSASETATMRAAFRAAAKEAAPAIVARLPGLPAIYPPDAKATQRVLGAIDRYAETSPEMTMFGRLILEAFPVPGPA